jgi:hypothetical protein
LSPGDISGFELTSSGLGARDIYKFIFADSVRFLAGQ